VNTVDVQDLTINEDNLFRWDNARHASDGTPVDTGSGSWEVKDDADPQAVVASGALAHVTGSVGRWQGAMDKADAANLVEGKTYYVELTLSDGAGADGFRRITCTAVYND
jgi:hypothetical protein